MTFSLSYDDVLMAPAQSVQHQWPVNMVKEDRTEFEAEISYETYACFLKFKGAVSVSPDSVFYRRLRVNKESIVSADLISYYSKRHLFKKKFFSKQVNLPKSKQYLLATDLWSAGHFHWITETLPRFWLIRDKAPLFTLLLPDHPYMRSIGEESFSMLGINFNEIIWMKDDSFYHVPELYYVPRMHRSGHMHPGILDQIRKQLIPAPVSGTKKIYISRAKAAFRKMVNEETFTSFLKQNGFEILFGENYTLKEQLQLFSGAHTLIGIHGAGLTNAIFQTTGSNLVELRRLERGPFNVGYWHLADAIGLKYYYFNGEPDSSLPLVGNGCNLSIDIDSFEKKVLCQL